MLLFLLKCHSENFSLSKCILRSTVANVFTSLSCVEGKPHKFELERLFICKGVHTWVQLNL